MADKVELITYADRLGGRPAGLRESARRAARRPVRRGARAAVLPPRTTAPTRASTRVDHTEVDQRLGTLGRRARASPRDIDVMADVIVNHVSAESPQFRGLCCEHGGRVAADDGCSSRFVGSSPTARPRRTCCAHLPPAARPAVHADDRSRTVQAPPGLDDVHPRADRHRRARTRGRAHYLDARAGRPRRRPGCDAAAARRGRLRR